MLSWLAPSQTGVAFLAVGGMVLSVPLFLGVAPVPVLLLLWLFYLSLVNDGQIFMSYQWDLLLLETLFVSASLAPRRLLPSRPTTLPSRLSFRLAHFVLFKLPSFRYRKDTRRFDVARPDVHYIPLLDTASTHPCCVVRREAPYVLSPTHHLTRTRNRGRHPLLHIRSP